MEYEYNGVLFPLKLIDNDKGGEVSYFLDKDDLEMNLEDYHSDHDTGCRLLDPEGKEVRLIMSVMSIIELRYSTIE